MSWRVGFVVWALLAAMPAVADELESDEVAATWKRHEVDLTARTPIGGTQNGDGFARVAMSAVHEGEVVVESRSPKRVKVGAMAGKQ